MTTFDKESDFYRKPTAAFQRGQPLVFLIASFVSDYAFVATLPVSLFIWFEGIKPPSPPLITSLAGLAVIYSSLMTAPTIVASVLAVPALLAWRTQRHKGFKRAFEIAFAILYCVAVVASIVGVLL